MLTYSRRKIYIYTALLLLLTTTGCNLLAQAEAPDLNINLTEQLPTTWEPVGDLQFVNIDGDERPEYLLFFRYGDLGGRGPIGAAIFDAQGPAPVEDDAGDEAEQEAETAEEANAAPDAELESSDPNLFLQMVGYRLLPRYWELERFEPLTVPVDDVSLVDPLADILVENTLPQFIASPDVGGDLIPLPIPDTALYVVEGGELLIRGGNTHITSVWWDPVEQDYQIAQAYASGGLSQASEEWSGLPNESALLAVNGSVRLFDRSWLCRRYRFERRVFPGAAPAAAADIDVEADVDTEVNPEADEPDEALVEVEVDAEVEVNDVGRPVVAIYYEQRPLGLGFCGAIPRQPFYPEAVALAYFLEPDGRDHLLDTGEGAPSPNALQQIIAASPGQAEREGVTYEGRRVLDIRTRATLPGPNATIAGAAESGAADNPQVGTRLLPVVCIDFLDGFALDSGEGSEPTPFFERRQLLFTLVYRVPAEPTVDDALRILSVREVPGDATVRTPCELLVDQRPPQAP